MDLQPIAEFISNTGFPIAAFTALAFLYYKQQENHKEESGKFTTAINELTIALTKLTEYLKGGE